MFFFKCIQLIFIVQASSSGQQDCMAFQASQGGGSVSTIEGINIGGSNNCLIMNPSSQSRSINLGFTAPVLNSNISLSLTSNIAGDQSSASTDYQDCGISPLFMAGESWDSSLQDAASPQARDKAKMRYHEKKKNRTYVLSKHFNYFILYISISSFLIIVFIFIIN